jgi:3-isopropylmalate/(R)-2-methylmalate dehydratase small subunit
MATGKVVRKLGDDVSTDTIYPGRFMATVLPSETPQFAFADDTELNKGLEAREIAPGSFLVAGKNFGCGSSREQAASCIKGHDLIVVARHFARIFLQNSINVGLNMVICPGIEAEEGHELEIEEGKVWNRSTGRSFPIEPLPKARQAIIDAGGLIPYARRLLLERNPG